MQREEISALGKLRDRIDWENIGSLQIEHVIEHNDH